MTCLGFQFYFFKFPSSSPNLQEVANKTDLKQIYIQWFPLRFGLRPWIWLHPVKYRYLISTDHRKYLNHKTGVTEASWFMVHPVSLIISNNKWTSLIPCMIHHFCLFLCIIYFHKKLNNPWTKLCDFFFSHISQFIGTCTHYLVLSTYIRGHLCNWISIKNSRCQTVTFMQNMMTAKHQK